MLRAGHLDVRHVVELGVELVLVDGGVGVRLKVAHLVGAAAAVGLDLHHVELLAREVGADLVEVGHHRQLVGDGQQHHVGGLKQAGDAQVGEAVVRLGDHGDTAWELKEATITLSTPCEGNKGVRAAEIQQ